MAAIEPIKVQGLREFQRALGKLDSDLPKALRIALNGAADIVVTATRPKIPRRSGRAQASLKARSTRTAVRVAEGSNRAPYMPWLDYGGRVGKNRSVARPFRKEGRYLYPTYADKRDEVTDALTAALVDVARQAGLEVT